MISSKRTRLLALLMGAASISQAAVTEEQHLSELRHTVENLLQALVDKGVLTREQAELMVSSAQSKAEKDAATEAAARAATEQAEAGAVRVPYVPQIVKDEIRKQVIAEMTPALTDQIVAEASSTDALARALPDWARRMRWSGDFRVRGQGDTYAEDNLPNSYIDVLNVNDRGGITKAGNAAFVNTTEDRQRLRLRARVGFDVELGWGWTAGARLTTGNLRDAVSTNQTLGNYGGRYTVGFDQAFVRWQGTSHSSRQSLALAGGRIGNPFLSTDLVFDQDLMFEGVATNYRYSLSRDEPFVRNWFFTAGAFPLQEVELSDKDKWLFAGQTGLDWRTVNGSRLRFAAAYYDYRNITGVRNGFGSNLLDYTAPVFAQRGNTLYDIRFDSDDTTNLLALAGEYQIANLTAVFDWRVSPAHRLTFTADAVENVGYDRETVLAVSGIDAEERTRGYLAEIAFGSARFNEAHAWRASVGYRYVERDAVLDAFTDSDFRLGGTDVKGFIIGADYAFSPRVFARLRYLSGNEIDGLPLGIDVLQLDMNASF
ncbi:MAG: putative porin [Pseudomonadota bacterium]